MEGAVAPFEHPVGLRLMNTTLRSAARDRADFLQHRIPSVVCVIGPCTVLPIRPSVGIVRAETMRDVAADVVWDGMPVSSLQLPEA